MRHPPWRATAPIRGAGKIGKRKLRRRGRLFGGLHDAELFREYGGAARERRAFGGGGIAHLLEDGADDVGLHEGEDFDGGVVVQLADDGDDGARGERGVGLREGAEILGFVGLDLDDLVVEVAAEGLDLGADFGEFLGLRGDLGGAEVELLGLFLTLARSSFSSLERFSISMVQKSQPFCFTSSGTSLTTGVAAFCMSGPRTRGMLRVTPTATLATMPATAAKAGFWSFAIMS